MYWHAPKPVQSQFKTMVYYECRAFKGEALIKVGGVQNALWEIRRFA
jgi:hypothetical protein